LARIAASAISAHGWFSLALSGGETPQALFALLAREYRTRIPWARAEIFWADERFVPHHDRRSNYGMTNAAWLAGSPVPRENIHPIPTDLPNAEDAARQYERSLRVHFLNSRPRFDLILLGLGTDGHTASLFPRSPALTEESRWAVAAEAPTEPAERVTLTLPVINHAAHVHFLVAGSGKAEALRNALSNEAGPLSCPASAVRPADGELIWWVDAAAAELLA
jgi:6-phosphogluconolactonase